MSEWKTVRLGDVCEIAAGQGAPQGDSNYCNDGTPFVKAGNLIELIEGKHENQIQKVSEEVAKSYKLKKYSAGSILFAKSGMSCMKGYVYQLKNDSYVVSHLAIVKPKEDSSNYIEYCLRHIKPNTLVKDEAYPSISLQDISNIQIPLPSLEEQKHIANVLDKCTVLIAKYKKMLAKYDTLIKSRFIELFGEYERTTTITRYISELRGGKSLAGTEPCKNKVLKTGAATFGWFDPEQYKYLPVDYEPLPEHKVETGDVIISRMNTPELVGACSYVFEAPEDMYYPDRLWKAVLKENTNPIFLWQLLWDRDIRKAIEESSSGTSGTMHNISKANLLAIKCIDAPIGLQNDFATFVQQIDKSKFAVQKSLEKAETLYKSLMQEYFG